ncbi:MAG TPA: xanthine dehydrogenase family protein molybdopterin-binding subunit, partial [Solirubrobacteraceae bacterium]|nr:xanthine dehydrogenase family protein molybdopterin-binding subunit [Solirubrobacteraceae bacterium]
MSETAAPARGVIGRSLRRKEDRPLLTGTACFVDDFTRPGALRAAVVRSPHAHARIAGIDASAALACPGVVDVVTAADLPDRDIRIPMRMYRRAGMERFLQPPLADGVARYAGEPVAVVIAESTYAAEDALPHVDVAYEPLDAVVDAGRAAEPGGTILHAHAGTNVAAEYTIAWGDVDDAFRTADLVVEERLVCGRHAAVPLEPRGLVAEVDAADGRLTVWGAAKVVHANRAILARLLGRDEAEIRFVELHVGGGFGARGEFYPEDFLIPFCALRTGRPVAWTEDRSENLRALNHSREQHHDVALALRADGTFLALRDRFVMDTGAYVRTHGTVVPNMTAGLLPGPYRWDAYRCEVRQVLTTKTPAGTYRAPGRYEANFVRERMIDLAAGRLGRDPAELRAQNLIGPEQMPYEVGTHTDEHPVVFDSGDYPRLLERTLERFGYAERRRWRAAPAGPGRRRGLGVALFVEKSGIARWEYARVGIAGDGRARVHVGSASVGQGVQTVLAQICAEHLGIAYDDVTVVHGDTDVVPEGMGSFGSRATSLGGAAVMEASTVLRERLLALAADELEASAGDLVIEAGRITVRGSPHAGIAVAELVGEPLEETARSDVEHMSFPYGVHCVAVEIDVETGAVAIDGYVVGYDVGRAINPQLVEGQVVGGAAQGIGGALLEELAYDDSGQLVSGSFMDYLMPTAHEVPPVDVLITEDAPTPLTALGAKGAGEGGTSAAGAAIANAVA